MMLNFTSPDGSHVLTFDDDGKVAYAYLKRGREIVGDVWLYNRCEAPDRTEWTDQRNLPFANCADFISKEGRVTKPISEDDVNVDWESEGIDPVAYIYVFKGLYGVVGVGEKPGSARFAIKDGPLAKTLEVEVG